jgi:hypothetical protein
MAGTRTQEDCSPRERRRRRFFGNGSYSFDGNTLIMTGDDSRRATAQFRLEQESKDFGRSWTDSMCLLSPGSSGKRTGGKLSPCLLSSIWRKSFREDAQITASNRSALCDLRDLCV